MITLYAKNLEEVWFGVACDGEKIFATAFAFNRKSVLHNLLVNIPFNVPFQYSDKTTDFVEKVISTLESIYHGKDVSKKFFLAMEHLSSYAQKVLETVALIPVGYIASYGSVAKAAGGSPRSVGRIMASNPFPLIVPCHRVVASNLSLGGYGGGLEVKLEILSRERRGHTTKREIPVDREKLQVLPVELLLNKKQKTIAHLANTNIKS
ncbi:MAG: methylated-DNA--[protein]-cysteine S-methyltransferase [Candidatus Bathyarchaeia archaeon]